MSIHVHKGDLPNGLDLGNSIAVDTETLGLKTFRDRLCVVQLSSGDGDAHLVQLDRADYDSAENLKRVLADPEVEKLYHFARFDLAAIQHYLGVWAKPVYCTKIASYLCRTFTDKHGLKDLCRDLIGVQLDKQAQSSDWAAMNLSEEQKKYAANDVLYLHDLRIKLDEMLAREHRGDLAQACFDFLPHRAALDLAGWAEDDVFPHALSAH